MSVNKKQSKNSESRDRILAAASTIFLRGGLAGLSVRAIAKRAGLSTIGIYSHFDGKQGILDALYIEGFERVAAAMDVTEIEGGPVAKIIAAARAYLTVADQYKAHYRLIFGEADDKYQPSVAAVQVSERAFGMLVDGVASLLPEEASKTERQQLALEVWAIVHGYVGLKNHAVSKVVEDIDWNELAITALEVHLQKYAS
jgi:AcrR family transcriptional regulator